MPSPAFILTVLQHAPIWVWGLLAALLALGLRQARPHSVSLRRMVALPLAMLTLSLAGAVSAFGAGAALACWTVGALLAAGWLLRGDGPRGVRWSAGEQRFHMPGSWLPMALILGIFCIKFFVGASLALHPAWRLDSGFAQAASLAYGAFSGLFAGRAVALLRLARQDGRLSLA